MKRIGNIYQDVISIENLNLADRKARKKKGYQYGIQVHDLNREANIERLHRMLADRTYRTSEYKKFIVRDPKEREVYCLPYFPDRITHHAIMNMLEPVFVQSFTANTYSCIKKRGIHAASDAVRKALFDEPGTQFCFKMDIRKFYPSIDHDILKALLRRKIKDQDLLWLLDEIIDSAPGVPIGNYLSQYFANFYLSYFDHWLKEVKSIKYYFRYADDLVILASSKPELHQILSDVRAYLRDELKLDVKDNYQIFPVAARGIDFVGYVHYHGHTRLRKSIKQRFARMVTKNYKPESFAAYMGWASKCDFRHLLKKLTHVSNSNQTLQRSGHSCSRIKGYGRFKDIDHQIVRQGDHRTPVPYSSFQTSGIRK